VSHKISRANLGNSDKISFANPKNACSYTRPVTNLEHQRRQGVFWDAPEFFKLCPTHFSGGGGEKYFRGDFAPTSYGSVLHLCAL